MASNQTQSVYNRSLHFCTSTTSDLKFEIFSTTALIASLISTLINSAFFLIVRRTKSYHANVHLLFQNFCLASLGLSLHTLGSSIYALLAIPFSFGPLSFPALPCQLSQIIFDVCHVTRVSIIWCLGFDRLIKVFMKHFSEHERATRSAYILAGFSWGLGIGTFMFSTGTNLTFMRGSDKVMICFCHWVFVRPFWTLCTSLACCLAAYSIIIGTYACLYRRSARALLIFSSRHRRSWNKHSSLTERYRLAKNVRLCQLWWPTVAIRFSLDLIYSSLAIFVSASMEAPAWIDIDPVFYTVMITNLMALDSICHPILLTMREGRLKRSATNVFPFLNRCVQAEEDYSDMLQHSIEEVTTLTDQGRLRFRRRSPTGETLELVDYRMNPEQHGNILNAMWSECAKNA